MTQNHSTVVLVVAAGRGSRVGTAIPKQYLALAGKPLLAHTLRALLDASGTARVLTVIHRDDEDLYAASIAALADADRERLLPPVPGGATRRTPRAHWPSRRSAGP